MSLIDPDPAQFSQKSQPDFFASAMYEEHPKTKQAPTWTRCDCGLRLTVKTSEKSSTHHHWWSVLLRKSWTNSKYSVLINHLLLNLIPPLRSDEVTKLGNKAIQPWNCSRKICNCDWLQQWARTLNMIQSAEDERERESGQCVFLLCSVPQLSRVL